MLGIGCPDRHPLLRITSPKLRRPRRLLPSRERVRSTAHPRRCRTPRRRSLCYAICRPSSWWIAGRGLCPGKPPESRLDGGEGNEGGQGFGKVFEVFGQTSVATAKFAGDG